MKKKDKREERIDFETDKWFNEEDHTNDGILATFKEGMKHAEDHPDEVFAWAIFNFIRDYQNGKFDFVLLQEALDANFKEYYKKYRGE